MNLNELIARRNKAWDDAQAFIVEYTNADGLMNEADRKAYLDLEAKVVAYKNAIEDFKAREAMEKELAKPTSAPLVTAPATTTLGSDEYKRSFLNAVRTGFRRVDDVLQEKVDADGGYLVPEEMDSRLIEALEEENVIRQLATKITTSGDHKINIADSAPAAAWVEEGNALSFGDATFKQVLLDAHKLHVGIKATDELLYDEAFNIESYITRKFASALANAEENAFLNGTGTTQPVGIFHETKGGQLAATLTAALKGDDIIDLIYSLKRPYRKNAVFLMNDSTIREIKKLKDTTGQYLWQPSLKEGEPDRILGYPIYTSQFAPADKIAFGDFSYYNIGDRGARTFRSLTELFAGNGMVGFLAQERVDGVLVLPEAIQILKLKSTASA